MTTTRTKVVGWRLGIALALLPLGACVAAVGVNNTTIPKNAAKICAGHCKTIGMTLSAVAIMADNVGCVCQYSPESKSEDASAGELSTPAAGMATIAIQEAGAARRRQQAAARH